MDITDFYKQARAWQMSKEEQERAAQIEHQAKLIKAWGSATKLIREQFPIQGIAIFPGNPEMTDYLPEVNHIYLFRVALPGVNGPLRYSEAENAEGVISVTLNCYAPYEFNLVNFGAHGVTYTTPYEAFLAAFPDMESKM